MQEKKIKIAIVGFGTVGSGVAKILLENAEHIYRKTSLRLELAHIVDTDLTKSRPVKITDGLLHNNLEKVLSDSDVSIAVSLIGGIEVECEIQKQLLAAGKDVVTANKALLAERGEEIFEVARKYQRCVAFEASCCGGIPIISAIRTGLSANKISAIYGIVNGTCNYILSGMSSEAKDYETALQEAQQAGFAEADPTLDVNGADSAHKLAILAMLAMGQKINFHAIDVKGIEDVNLADIQYGRELGYTMKLLAIAEQTSQGLSLRVHPTFISNEEQLAKVSGPFNAVSVFGDAVGHTSYYGQGAGMMPTASAIVADIIEVAHGNAARSFNATCGLGKPALSGVICPPDEIESRYYLRLSVVDRPGVFAQIARILGLCNISIAACLQHESVSPQCVPVVIMTHHARQGDMNRALADIELLEVVKAKSVCIPVVTPPVNGHK